MKQAGPVVSASGRLDAQRRCSGLLRVESWRLELTTEDVYNVPAINQLPVLVL